MKDKWGTSGETVSLELGGNESRRIGSSVTQKKVSSSHRHYLSGRPQPCLTWSISTLCSLTISFLSNKEIIDY